MSDTRDDDLRADFDSLAREVRSMDPNEPGLALRVDRIERRLATLMAVISWIGAGGLGGLATAVYLLVEIGRKLNPDKIP